MLRKWLADFAFDMAKDRMDRAEQQRWLRDYIRWRGYSRWWADVELLIRGTFGPWGEIRSSRKRAALQRSKRRNRPIAQFAILGPTL